ncbi:MAG: DUF262 domain-containing protein [Dissulfurispiraceae bacterium]
MNLASTFDSPEVDYYTIPQYQRPYRWETEHYETLWEDLIDAYHDYVTTKNEGLPPEYYFLGPGVFVKNAEKKSYDIIDGQQRATTLHIMLWYLYRRLTDETEKKRILRLLTSVLIGMQSPPAIENSLNEIGGRTLDLLLQ